MPNPIPDFDYNSVLPPHTGDPRLRTDLSPYPCTTVDLCDRFATSTERIKILKGLLTFREKLQTLGLTQGFQWLDGSFLEDIETIERRSPKDLDIVTVFWGYDKVFQNQLVIQLPEFQNPVLAKAHFMLDHYPLDAGYHPIVTVEHSRYWIQLFSHNRNSIWKGMLKIELNTPILDKDAFKKIMPLTP